MDYRFGSPFQHDPAHTPPETEGGLKRTPSAPSEGLPIVLWDGEDRTLDEDEPGDAPVPHRPSFKQNLGMVTFKIRGRNDTAYSVRSARLTDECTLIPLPKLASTPRFRPQQKLSSGEDDDDESDDELDSLHPMSLHRWLNLVRRDSSKKAPLPRDWQYPIGSVQLLLCAADLLLCRILLVFTEESCIEQIPASGGTG